MMGLEDQPFLLRSDPLFGVDIPSFSTVDFKLPAILAASLPSPYQQSHRPRAPRTSLPETYRFCKGQVHLVGKSRKFLGVRNRYSSSPSKRPKMFPYRKAGPFWEIPLMRKTKHFESNVAPTPLKTKNNIAPGKQVAVNFHQLYP